MTNSRRAAQLACALDGYTRSRREHRLDYHHQLYRRFCLQDCSPSSLQSALQLAADIAGSQRWNLGSGTKLDVHA
jgi:hypothetical protein